MDRGDGDPVQVAALPLGRRPGVGHSAARASVRRKNEWAYLTPVPQNLGWSAGVQPDFAGGTLVGLDLPPAGKNLELKPYARSRG